MTTKIKLGDGDSMGVSLPVITDYNISIGTGANDFVIATSGDISQSKISFGDGALSLAKTAGGKLPSAL